MHTKYITKKSNLKKNLFYIVCQQVLLNLLADNRQLTVLQYDKVISYLQGRKELQLKVELGDTSLPTTTSNYIFILFKKD